MFAVLQEIADLFLFASCLIILLGSIYLTFKLRFIQVTLLPSIIKMLKQSLSRKNEEEGTHTILPHKALFTAMSTTLGISTIAAPVIAINLGGPGALLGFLLTAFFGSAATYAEVMLSIRHRKTLAQGDVMGGPMQYLQFILSPFAAKYYALCCLILMTAWSGAQANQLSAILDSPMLGNFRLPAEVTGVLLALLLILALTGGIKRIGSLSSKLVPLMFIVYLSSTAWILLCNIDKWGTVLSLMFTSILTPYAMASGTLVGGIYTALRWGIFKGTQACEAGVGTQAIPHAAAETNSPQSQAALAMLSTYTAGFISFLSGCVALVTDTWQDPSLPLGISMIAASFQQYFSYFGVLIIAASALLFGFGTCLGNSYNGSQCFAFLTNSKNLAYYSLATACMVFLGSIAEVKTVWSVIDLILTTMAIPHMAALMLWHARKKHVLISENAAIYTETY